MAICLRSTIKYTIRSKYCGVRFYQESTNNKQAANSAINTMNLNRNNCVKCNNIDTSKKIKQNFFVQCSAIHNVNFSEDKKKLV